MRTTTTVALLCTLGAVAASVAYAPSLPAEVPVHWNVRGEPDGWGPRGLLLALGPVLTLLPVGVGAALRLDPRQPHVDASHRPIAVVLGSLSVFLLGVHLLALRGAASPEHGLALAPFLVLLGALWAAIGWALPRTRSMFLFGIRTPWTLESEEVWARTHRLGGWTFGLGGGIAALAAVALPDPARGVVALVGLIGGALVPAVASWVYWRRLEGVSADG